MNQLPDLPLPADYPSVAPFRLGAWTVHPAQHRLTSGDQIIQIEPRMMHVLVCLAARPGEVVTRGMLAEAVWADAVVGEDSLTRVVSMLRRALGDRTREPRFIETIWKVGYRLLVDVEPVAAEGAASAVRGGRSRRGAILAVTLAAVVLAVGGLWWARRPADQPVEPPVVNLAARPLTSERGLETMPAVSADGTRVAYCFWSPDHAGWRIAVHDLDTGLTSRPDFGPGNYCSPRWSPAGDRLVYVHRLDRVLTIRHGPAEGGEAVPVLESRWWIDNLDWSPDGQRLVVSRRAPEALTEHLTVLELDANDEHPLTSPPAGHRDLCPRWSPDGQLVAFYRVGPGGLAHVLVTGLDGAAPDTLTRVTSNLRGITWQRDGRAVLAASYLSGGMGLVELGLDGSRRFLATRGAAQMPSQARGADVLVFERGWADVDVWTLALDRPGAVPRPLVDSTRIDRDARLSPVDGTLAFVSDRSGFTEIWLRPPHATEPHRLTHLDGAHVKDLRWSPDGRRLACSVFRDGHYTLALVGVDDGQVSTVLEGPRHHHAERWSDAGDWIVYAQPADGVWDLHRVRPDGRDDQLLWAGASRVVGPGPGGEGLIVKLHASKDMVLLPGGEPVQHPVLTGDYLGSQSDGEALYLLVRDGHEHALLRQPLAAGSPDTLARLQPTMGPEFHLAADGSAVVFTHTQAREQDLMVVRQQERPSP